MKKIYENIKKSLAWVFLLPFIGGITTFLGIIAGYLGSLYMEEISNTFLHLYYPAWLVKNPVLTVNVFEPHSTWFWISAILAGSLFTGTFWAQSVSSKETNDEIKRGLNNLFTLPVKDFILTYSNLMMFSNEIEKKLPPSPQVADVELLIRVQLNTICGVCSKYDIGAEDAAFAANVMLFIEAGSADFIARLAILQSRTRCIESAVVIEKLSGVLELKLNLSVRGISLPDPDITLSALCLPVPNNIGDAKIYIPGAPSAFMLELRPYRSQSDLISKVEENRKFSSDILSDIKSTFDAQTKTVKSLMCIPLKDASSGKCIGVLNIHKDLDDEAIAGKMKTLGPLLAALVRNLENLIALYR